MTQNKSKFASCSFKMAAKTSSAVETPHFEIVSKIDSVPIIHDSVLYAHALITSNTLTARLYNTAVGLASKGYEVATPVLSKTKPLLETADGLAVATFDRAAATFPYPFTTPTGDLVVVKQAKGVYDTRINPIISDVVARTAAINSAIGSRASATIHQSQDLAHHFLEQLQHLTEHGAHLPAILLDSVYKAGADFKAILFAKDVTLQEKSNKLASYIVEQAKPVMDEVYNYVNASKAEVVEKTDEVPKKAEGSVKRFKKH
ncbi:hypothetical protein L204_100387 [Cryptococcus depauperatus]